MSEVRTYRRFSLGKSDAGHADDSLAEKSQKVRFARRAGCIGFGSDVWSRNYVVPMLTIGVLSVIGKSQELPGGFMSIAERIQDAKKMKPKADNRGLGNHGQSLPAVTIVCRHFVRRSYKFYWRSQQLTEGFSLSENFSSLRRLQEC